MNVVRDLLTVPAKIKSLSKNILFQRKQQNTFCHIHHVECLDLASTSYSHFFRTTCLGSKTSTLEILNFILKLYGEKKNTKWKKTTVANNVENNFVKLKNMFHYNFSI